MRRPGTPGTCAGLKHGIHGGMTMIGNVIRDAWVFEILPETETCEGRTMSRINSIHRQG